jgi:prepilin-type N-terminal cleavage/methylation domain-containing protein
MMTSPTIRQRRGVTLTEVLIATGIMAVGMTAILALFPIGAVNMARAINQDRTATHAMNSDNLFRVHWKNAWVERDPISGVPSGSIVTNTEAAYQNSAEPMIPLLEAHPVYGHLLGDWTLADATTGAPPPNWKYPNTNTEPSYPVLVDPIGWQTKAGTQAQGFIAGIRNLPVRTTLRASHQESPGPAFPAYVRIAPDPYADQASRIPQIQFFQNNYPLPFTAARRNFPPVAPAPYPWQGSLPQVIRNTTLLDDMTFDQLGEPAAATGQLERGGRYSVAWLIQRTTNAAQSEVNVQVLAFSGRSPTDTPSEEYAYTFAGNINQPNTVLLDITNLPIPPIKKGGWIALSLTVPRPPLLPNGPPNGAYPTFDFYRVISVNDETPNRLVVELESPMNRYGMGTPTAPTFTGTAVVFDNLFEVYDRGSVSAVGNVKP